RPAADPSNRAADALDPPVITTTRSASNAVRLPARTVGANVAVSVATTTGRPVPWPNRPSRDASGSPIATAPPTPANGVMNPAAAHVPGQRAARPGRPQGLGGAGGRLRHLLGRPSLRPRSGPPRVLRRQYGLG